MPEAKDITDPSVKFSTELGLVHPISHDDQVRKAYMKGCKDGLRVGMESGYDEGWERGFDAGLEDAKDNWDGLGY